MDREELLQRAKNPQHISGIFNYCDRWCERCAFTSRCLSHAMETDRKRPSAADDGLNESFWESIRDAFQSTMELIRDFAEARGIDLDALQVENEEETDNTIHILSIMTKRYAAAVNEWFDGHDGYFDGGGETVGDHPQTERVASQTDALTVSLKEAIEVIDYYKYFIHVKLERALDGKNDPYEAEFDGIPKDSDGSAKVALIAMDRSIGAWSILMNHTLNGRNAALSIVQDLNRIRTIAEREFPDARAFVRPGFDEVAALDDVPVPGAT